GPFFGFDFWKVPPTPTSKKPLKLAVVGLTFASRVRSRLIRTRHPIPLPQPLRLVCAAKRVEGVGGDAGAGLGQRVILSKSLVVCGKRGLTKGQRFGRLTYGEEEARQIVARTIGALMLGAKRLREACKRALLG